MMTPMQQNIEIGVKPDTRNHKGHFIPDSAEAAYTFVRIDPTGWALICQDDAICHYVDPACLQEFSA